MHNKEIIFDREFQKRLINEVITDQKFGTGIIPILHATYFDDERVKLIIQTIRDAYIEDEVLLNFKTLKLRVLEHKSLSNDIKKDKISKIIDAISDADRNDYEHIQKKAMVFCKQQELKKAIVKVNNIIENDDGEKFYECEDIIKTALELGETKDDSVNVFSNVDSVLAEDFRDPIPTGISGMDASMGGGLGKGELGVILAPYGVGKSTMITKIANTAKMQGKYAVQIYFEDQTKVIQRKHFSCLTGIPLNELSERRSEVEEKIQQQKNTPGDIILKKFPSDGITIPIIKQFLKKLLANGQKIDMVLIDYIDCVKPSKAVKDEYNGEGDVMRQFESMISELNIVGWTAVQGNRCVGLDTIVDVEGKGKIKIIDARVGDKIMTHKGYKKITMTYPVTKQAVYKITTKSGKTIKVSAKHEFPTKHGKLKSISTGLKTGDKLFLGKKK